MKKSYLIYIFFIFSQFSLWSWDWPWNSQEINTENLQDTSDDTHHLKGNQTFAYNSHELLNALSIAECRSASIVREGLSWTKKHITRDNSCFVLFDSLKDITLQISPLGFYIKHQTPFSDGRKTDIRQKTFGMQSGAEINVIENLVLGIGIGYLYTDIDWKNAHESGAHSNSVFLEPSVTYLLPKGMIGISIFGMRNCYRGSLTNDVKESIDLNHASWDLSTHLEGTLDIEIPETVSQYLFIHPHFGFDYLNVFEGKYSDIKSRRSSFIQTLISLGISKTVGCTKTTFIKPQLSIGWAGWYPLTNGSIKIKDHKTCVLKVKRKSQFFLESTLTMLFKKGFVLGINYQSYIGAKSPIHSAKISMEWNW